MTRVRRLAALGLVVLAWVATPPADASCARTLLISSVSGSAPSYVYSPFVCSGQPCPPTGSVSGNLTGAFWALGFGNPAPGQGHDNGSFAALDGAYPLPYYAVYGWVRSYPYYPAFVYASWGSPWPGSPDIDGCIDDVVAPGEGCTAVLLADLDEAPFVDEPYFALLSDRAASVAEFFDLGPPGGGSILLQPTPTVFHQWGEVDGEPMPTFSIVLPEVTAGLELDPSCADPLLGYRLYQWPDFEVTTFDRQAWQPAQVLESSDPIRSGWATVQFNCDHLEQVFLGYTLVFESGYELPWITQVTGTVSPTIGCCTDLDADAHCPDSAFEVHTDCDDADPTVYFQAPQVCDGRNNDCNVPGWPSLAGTNEADDDGDGLTECAGDCDDAAAAWTTSPSVVGASLAWTDKTSFAWQPIGDAGAYNVYRGDLSAAPPVPDCLAAGVPTATAADTTTPTGGGFFYLVAAANSCGEGSLGQTSAGQERTAALACP